MEKGRKYYHIMGENIILIDAEKSFGKIQYYSWKLTAQ